MYDLLLGEDPSNWPWSAYINLPILPFSLILSRFQTKTLIPPFIPILLATPSSFAMNRKVAEYWTLPENARRLMGMPPKPLSSTGRSWPPSPILFGLFGLPMVQMLYQRLYSQVYLKVMGTLPPVRTLGRRRDGNQQAQPNRNANANANANGNGNGINAPARRNNRQAMVNIGAGIRVHVNDDQAADPEGDFAEDGEVIHIQAGSLGRKIAGALLTPAIASWMGNLLLRMSRRSTLLRELLAIRQPIGGVWVPPPLDMGNRDWHTLTTFRQMTLGVQMVARGLWGSARTFSESDPVWWRNTIGLVNFETNAFL
ncbi:hypothetical protein H1R20_g12113, partial [Candolleomyces eurysporus]